MTSYTRKLHAFDPSAARAIHRQQYLDYRYGKNVTLAHCTLDAAPVPTAEPVSYECWAPELGKPREIRRALNSFYARKEYARYHQITVTDVAARRVDNGGSR